MTKKNHSIRKPSALVAETAPTEDLRILQGLMRGTVGELVAPGSIGKSRLALAIAAGVASSPNFGGDILGINATRGQAIYIASEDPVPALVTRIHELGRHMSDDAGGISMVIIDTLSRMHSHNEKVERRAVRPAHGA